MLEEECSESDSEPICRPPPVKRKLNKTMSRRNAAILLGADESDEDVTSDQLDRRRHLCQQRMLLAERQFNQIKLTIRDLKLKELEIKKTRIANRTAPEFQERAKELKKHFQIKEEIAKARRALSLDSLERRIAGQRHIAKGNQVDNISNTQDLLREVIRERILQEHRKLEKMNNFEHFHKSILDTPALFNRRSPSKSKHRSFNIPIVIYQLDKAQIMEDVEFMEKLRSESE